MSRVYMDRASFQFLVKILLGTGYVDLSGVNKSLFVSYYRQALSSLDTPYKGR